MPKPRRCAYCGEPAEGHFSIHRDGFAAGPEVPLCDGCGGEPTPTCEEIWERISRRKGGWKFVVVAGVKKDVFAEELLRSLREVAHV